MYWNTTTCPSFYFPFCTRMTRIHIWNVECFKLYFRWNWETERPHDFLCFVNTHALYIISLCNTVYQTFKEPNILKLYSNPKLDTENYSLVMKILFDNAIKFIYRARWTHMCYIMARWQRTFFIQRLQSQSDC